MTVLRSSSVHRVAVSFNEKHAQPKKDGAEPPSKASHHGGEPHVSYACAHHKHTQCTSPTTCTCPICGNHALP